MESGEGFVRFRPDAHRFYEALNDAHEILDLWEQLLFLGDSPEVDFETIFEIPYGDDVYKIVYGPPFTIAFRNEPEHTLLIRLILRPSF